MSNTGYGWYLRHFTTGKWIVIKFVVPGEADLVEVVAHPRDATKFDTHDQAWSMAQYLSSNPNFPPVTVEDATIPDAPTPDANPLDVKSFDAIVSEARARSDAASEQHRQAMAHEGGYAPLLARVSDLPPVIVTETNPSPPAPPAFGADAYGGDIRSRPLFTRRPTNT